MNEMIERVARAICAGCGDNPDSVGEPPSDVYPVAGHAFPRWFAYRAAARAAIEAMRVPDEAMDNAGARLTGISPGMADTAWRAMIDAALTEP